MSGYVARSANPLTGVGHLGPTGAPAGGSLAEIEPTVEYIIERELAVINDFTARLAQGQLPVW